MPQYSTVCGFHWHWLSLWYPPLLTWYFFKGTVYCVCMCARVKVGINSSWVSSLKRQDLLRYCFYLASLIDLSMSHLPAVNYHRYVFCWQWGLVHRSADKPWHRNVHIVAAVCFAWAQAAHSFHATGPAYKRCRSCHKRESIVWSICWDVMLSVDNDAGATEFVSRPSMHFPNLDWLWLPVTPMFIEIK